MGNTDAEGQLLPVGARSWIHALVCSEELNQLDRVAEKDGIPKPVEQLAIWNACFDCSTINYRLVLVVLARHLRNRRSEIGWGLYPAHGKFTVAGRGAQMMVFP